MGVRDLFKWGARSAVPARQVNASHGEAGLFLSTTDPRVIEFLKEGLLSATGMPVNVESALRNPSMFRAVSLISNAIGMLPCHLIEKATKKKATAHPLYRVIHRRPNDWQTAFDFRATMQLRALVHKDAYALIVRSFSIRTGKKMIVRLVPLDSRRMHVTMQADWTLRYEYQPTVGGKIVYAASDIFHLRGLSLDGIHGFSLVEQAREAIGLALSAELAAGRIFKNGAFVDGVLISKAELSEEAFNRLKESWAERYMGADNAGKTPLLEGDTDYKAIGSNARDAQMAELRKLQVEEIARVTGVPRPLLMVDETSWGSGIEALGQFFVAYALGPWFEAWQQAIERSLLDDGDAEIYEAKFNPGALLRGSLKDQADYFAKALGAGGHQPWMHYDEVRDVMDLPEREAPVNPMMGHNGPPIEPEPEAKPKPSKPKKPVEENDDDE
ncbi:phage portal protein [Pararhizobium sp. YC-54]|uniref:phage portal protein n=1 Tax=Pararhizobium sp. YC-54 TaxID=2986920 RepID=UPI0021F7AA89|nr:phage portal protein [Pararhizobium sp. YC-54]MCV9997335.1 phage portal protein [Pararhizobium sp. YC-54]